MRATLVPMVSSPRTALELAPPTPPANVPAPEPSPPTDVSHADVNARIR
jgi:hypothetical protein